LICIDKKDAGPAQQPPHKEDIMTVTVETLEKLERKITLTLPVGTIQNEVDSRLKKLARTVKMDGFRPGKVPLSVVAQRYGYSVQYEVMNDKVGEAFLASGQRSQAARGRPAQASPRRKSAPEGELAFDAVFEVYPEVKINDLAGALKSRRLSGRSGRRRDRQARWTSCASSAAPSPSARRTPLLRTATA
jgi:hypothetical protein